MEHGQSLAEIPPDSHPVVYKLVARFKDVLFVSSQGHPGDKSCLSLHPLEIRRCAAQHPSVPTSRTRSTLAHKHPVDLRVLAPPSTQPADIYLSGGVRPGM